MNYAIEASSNAIIFATLEGEISYVNRAFLRLWEYDTASEVLGKPISTLAGIEGEADRVAEAILQKGEWVGEITPVKKGGGKFLAQVYANLITDEKNRPLFLMSSVSDITEMKNVQAALIRSEETYAKAEEIAHIGSWDWNILTGDLRWTDEIYRIFGQEPQSFGATYEAFLESIHPDDRQKVVDAVNAAVEDDSVAYQVEHRVVRAKDNHIRIVQERGKVYRDPDGKPHRMIGTVYDVTEQRLAESELDAYRERLEELVTERTRELHRAQDELVKKERLATLGQLTATVSHELRNPLGAMRPSLYLIRKKVPEGDKKIDQAIIRIDRNIERCDNIIDELLDFTRITSLSKQETIVNHWLDAVLEEMNIPHNVELVKHYLDDEIHLTIDKGRFRRAIINIVENAYQAILERTDDRSPRLDIYIRSTQDGVAFVVEDNGIGIPEDVKQRMFEPLYSTKGFGVGLGMSTVKQIMQQHGGSVEVESDPGEGTSVTLWLPRVSRETGVMYDNSSRR
jgi:PAS domain S-box-containing protein